MLVDTVQFDQYCEVLLLQRLGYVMHAEVAGQAHVVKQVRMIGGDGRNLEVLTSQGWKVPDRCWAELHECQPEVEQQGLFG